MKRSLAFAALAMVGGAAAGQVDTFAFMPDGGRGTFARAFPAPAVQRDALSQARSAEDWLAALADLELTQKESATLAAYLSRVAPLDAKDPIERLPPDGRDLALAQCQSCHSLFSGYLTQRRDRNGWLVIFASPFHKDIPMSRAEREIFADYSAINMPMRVEDVPPEMRF